MEELETTMAEKFAKMESMIMGSQGDAGYQDTIECSNAVAQVLVLKRYPAKLFVTAFTCLFGLPHFLAIAAFTQTEAEWWKVHFGGEFFTILYTGLVASGFAFSLQFWCICRGWPVVVAVWDRLLPLWCLII
ncbi:hypothetical protein Taro_014859 [Colocasia esculenta]|uniref:Uncharacterized protein n=1 Tax=Colocasia esculenta TaxID=4460 RepID=A0A843UJV1_COLES|nr:hypothetical protein [Colocasia esculenta]